MLRNKKLMKNVEINRLVEDVDSLTLTGCLWVCRFVSEKKQ